MNYFDTCYIVKCYLVENGTSEVREFLADVGGAASCMHARVEFVTAIHRQYREQQITNSEMVFSNDRHLLKAAPFFGVRGTNVIPAL